MVDLTISFVSTILSVLARIAAIPAVQTVLRLATKETSGRGEVVLATAGARARWAVGTWWLPWRAEPW